MAIKFPKMHIAESVVNRLMNLADDLPEPQAATAAPVPTVPNTALQSIDLDQALAQPVSGALPGIDQAPDPGATLNGAPLLDTVLEPGP